MSEMTLNRREAMSVAAAALCSPAIPQTKNDFREYRGELSRYRYSTHEGMVPNHVLHEIFGVMNSICRKCGGTWRMCNDMRQHFLVQVFWNRPNGETCSWSFDVEEPWVKGTGPDWFWKIYQRAGWMMEEAGLNCNFPGLSSLP